MNEKESETMSETTVESHGVTVGKIEGRGREGQEAYLATHLASNAQLVTGTLERAVDWILEMAFAITPSR